MKSKKMILALFISSVLTGISQTDPFYRQPTENGLISHWSMENTSNDVFGNNNPVQTNNISFQPGRIGQAVSLGHGGYIDIPHSQDLTLQTYTIEAWVKPLGNGPNNDVFGSVIVEKDLNAPFGNDFASFSMGWSSLSNRFYASSGSFSTQLAFSNNFFLPGEFYHVLSTFDGQTLKLYVNGNLEAVNVSPNGYVVPYDAEQPWGIGTSAADYRFRGYPRTFNGLIDEVKIFDRALSEEEILTNYNYTQDNGFITGKVYSDDDENCQFSSPDIRIARCLMIAEPGPYYTYTDNEGNYQFNLPEGDYTIGRVDGQNAYLLSPCQSDGQYQIHVTKNTYSVNHDFSLRPNPPVCNGEINVASIPNSLYSPGVCEDAPLVTPCPGHLHEYCITITNSGNIPLLPASTVVVTIDPFMSYTGITNNPCGFNPPTIVGNQLTWTLPKAINPGAICTICISVMVNQIQPFGWTTNATLNAVCPPNSNHVYSDNNIDYNACSCDPNDKTVSPIGCGTEGSVNIDETLTYKIRFENIGSGNAHNVVVREFLDDDLDLTSIKIIESSHSITGVEIIPNNILIFDFQGIELPGTNDPMNSKGYLIFSVKPKIGIADATQITNHAAIYFDNNKPVITNTTLNTLRNIPNPIADFESKHACNSIEAKNDFFYTGGTVDGATFSWDFGNGALPSQSSEINPSGIEFESTGNYDVTLNVTRYGCTSSTTKSIDVLDIHCGKNNDKILICFNGKTLCIPQNAVSQHIKNGACVGSCDIQNKSMSNLESSQHSLKEQITLFPNPTSGKVNIQFGSDQQLYSQIRILDVSGKEVFVKSIRLGDDETQFEIDLSAVNPGMYFVELSGQGEKQIFKLEKQ